mmetsp:Transcript_12284/g.37490  ORF Transcript_12284/g.37490 Transcript_12284/m.37490 type:complete len:304 (+) Transcript_12284:229-1140(+)
MSAKARAKSLRRVYRHAMRSEECEILDRILYRNRSQHRAGRYFRRVQCALRSRRRIDDVALWPYVNDGATFDVKLLEPLIRDYEDAYAHFKAVTEKAQEDLVEMISQSFFMPFCVAAWACLARIAAVEAQMHCEVVALAAAVRNVNLQGQAEEDLGEIVPGSREEGPAAAAAGRQPPETPGVQAAAQEPVVRKISSEAATTGPAVVNVKRPLVVESETLSLDLHTEPNFGQTAEPETSEAKFDNVAQGSFSALSERARAGGTFDPELPAPEKNTKEPRNPSSQKKRKKKKTASSEIDDIFGSL